jgi:hypothetical protein
MLAAVKFDALITVDKNLAYQQNKVCLTISVFVLKAQSNELPYMLALVPKLEVALASYEPGAYVLLRADP